MRVPAGKAFAIKTRARTTTCPNRLLREESARLLLNDGPGFHVPEM
jgi:hypothetical protein